MTEESAFCRPRPDDGIAGDDNVPAWHSQTPGILHSSSLFAVYIVALPVVMGLALMALFAQVGHSIIYDGPPSGLMGFFVKEGHSHYSDTDEAVDIWAVWLEAVKAPGFLDISAGLALVTAVIGIAIIPWKCREKVRTSSGVFMISAFLLVLLGSVALLSFTWGFRDFLLAGNNDLLGFIDDDYKTSKPPHSMALPHSVTRPGMGGLIGMLSNNEAGIIISGLIGLSLLAVLLRGLAVAFMVVAFRRPREKRPPLPFFLSAILILVGIEVAIAGFGRSATQIYDHAKVKDLHLPDEFPDPTRTDDNGQTLRSRSYAVYLEVNTEILIPMIVLTDVKTDRAEVFWVGLGMIAAGVVFLVSEIVYRVHRLGRYLWKGFRLLQRKLLIPSADRTLPARSSSPNSAAAAPLRTAPASHGNLPTERQVAPGCAAAVPAS